MQIVMRSGKPKKHPTSQLEQRIAALENQAAEMGIQIHYDLLEAAGLKLKGGICCVNGEYHLFVDRSKSLPERIDFLESHLKQPPDQHTAVSDDQVEEPRSKLR